MELKYIKTMVKERKRNRGLKYTPSYRYNKHWIGSSNNYLEILNDYGLLGNVLNKSFKIGGIIIQ